MKSARKRARGAERLGAARLAAVQALYQGDLRKEEGEQLVAEFRRHRLGHDIDGAPAIPPDDELFAGLVLGVAARSHALDTMIAELLPANWPFARLEVILRAILRAAAFEMESHLTTPARTVINEYVEIGHAFFSGSEPKMINGILDKLARRLRPGELSGAAMADDKLPDEFALIKRYFAPLATHKGAVGLTDDVALIAPAAGLVHVLKTDTLIEGVHYLADDPAEMVGRKLLRVNLSDLAAKGARPVGYMLAASFSRTTRESWLAAFVKGLAADQQRYGLVLLGGDTTATPGPTTLSVTVIGEADEAKVPRRSGAKPGHDIYVTGTLGDAALGLRVLKGELRAAESEFLVNRYRLPEPRVALGHALVGIAASSIDVSDGLLADLGHICEQSGVRAEVIQDAIPLSHAASTAVASDPALWSDIVSGGDDYEILFTAPPGACGRLTGVTRIGRILTGRGVALLDPHGRPIELKVAGYRHF